MTSSYSLNHRVINYTWRIYFWLKGQDINFSLCFIIYQNKRIILVRTQLSWSILTLLRQKITSWSKLDRVQDGNARRSRRSNKSISDKTPFVSLFLKHCISVQKSVKLWSLVNSQTKNYCSLKTIFYLDSILYKFKCSMWLLTWQNNVMRFLMHDYSSGFTSDKAGFIGSLILLN